MNNEKPINHLVERAFNALKKEYMIIGKTHVRAWHAWLFIGLAVGVVVGIILIANRSGKFEVTKASVTPIGWLDVVNGNGMVSGWALDPDNPSQSIAVHFYVDGPAGSGVFAGNTLANIQRLDVNQVTGFLGDHGYTFVIPPQFRDGRTHSLFVHSIDTSGSGSENVLLSGVPKNFTLTPVVKDNGVLRVSFFDGGYPAISSLKILGLEIIPQDNAGGDFQMAARNSSVNPTLGGDCTGASSLLTGLIPNWSGGGLSIDSRFGLLMGVDPRNYQQAGFPPVCSSSAGQILPYDFNFGITLGDGASLPREMAVMDMSIRREQNSTTLPRVGAEVPVAFPKTSVMRFAYSSIDGVAFSPMIRTSTNSNDVSGWPLDQVGVRKDAKAVMLCNIADALERPNDGFCMAFYSNFVALADVGHRRGKQDLTLISLLGDSGNGFGGHLIDFDWYTIRRILAVGNVNTIRAVINIANLNITDWGNWRR